MTYLGGGSSDIGESMVVNRSGNMYVTGSTDSSDFPIANPLQSTLSGVADVFVARRML
ncbi:MAG: SBBP repeat-containing protein [Ardenticatenaceae bacterium]